MIRSFFTAIGLIAFTSLLSASAFADSQQALNRSGYPTYGNESAKVTIVEFFDPACETCSMLNPYLKNLVDNSNGKVKLTMRYANLHQGSDKISMALEATRLQDKYWPALQVLFDTQPMWASHDNPRPDMVWKVLDKIGVDVAKAQTDMNNPATIALINQDAADVETLTITKTPGFFVNGKPLVQFGLDELVKMVNDEISVVYGK